MKIDLIGGSYQHKYKDFNPERTINWYPVAKASLEKDKNESALFPFAGLTQFCPLSGTTNRALNVVRTLDNYRCFSVVDTTLYEVLANGGSTNRGSLSLITSGASKIYITCDAGQYMGIFHPSASYYYNLNTNTLAQITDGQFPGSVVYADYQNGVTFIVSNGIVYYSDLNNLSSWTALDFFGASTLPAPAIAVGCHKDRIFVFTSASIEPFVNDGTTPYSKVQQTTNLIGLAVKDTLAKFNNGFFFVGRDQERGEVSVYFLSEDYSIKPISDPSITWAINSAGNSINEAYGYVQLSKDNHIMYHLTIPELKTTYIFNLMTGAWSERQSTNPVPDSDGAIVQAEYRGKQFVSFSGYNLFSDVYSANINRENWSVFTELDTTIYRTRISPCINQEDKLIDINELIIDVNTGYALLDTDPVIQLSISRDGGYTFEDPLQMLLGRTGQYSFRSRIQALGSSRNWVFKFVCSENIDIMIQSLDIHGNISTW